MPLAVWDELSRTPASQVPTRGWLRRVAAGFMVALLAIGLVGWIGFATDALLSSLPTGPLGTESDAEAVLRDISAFHGDPTGWASQPELQIELRGSVPFLPARLAFGLATSDVALTMRYRPGEYGGYHYELVEGGDLRRGRVSTSEDRDGLGLLLDSVRHLVELPFTLSSVPYRRGLPPGPTGARRAFLTWGADPEPTAAHDQIVVWSDGGHLHRMDTTGRDIAPFIVARVIFEGLVEHAGFRLPARATVFDDDAVVHRWEVVSIRALSPPDPLPESR